MSIAVLLAVSLFASQTPPPIVEAPNAAPIEESGPPPMPAAEPEAPAATIPPATNQPLPTVPPLTTSSESSAPVAQPVSAPMTTVAPPMSAPPPPPSEPAMSAPPAVAAAPAASNAPTWELGAWATATIPTSLNGSAFMFGGRVELDIWRIGVVATFDRIGVTPFTIGDTNYWNGLLGYSLVSTDLFRVRALGGVSALSGSSITTRFAPSFGTTAHFVWHFIGAEGSAVFTAGAFRQLDLRAAVILRGGIFEVQLGYRAKWIDATTGGTVGNMFTTSNSAEQITASAPTAPVLVGGPHLSIGLVF